jgi:hypothetical protein
MKLVFTIPISKKRKEIVRMLGGGWQDITGNEFGSACNLGKKSEKAPGGVVEASV